MPLSNKEKYRKLCDEKDIPLFMQAWWMDTVCYDKKEWDVILYEKGKEIKGALVFHTLKKLGFNLILQPELTQYNGIWIDYEGCKLERQRLSQDKKVMSELINQLEEKKIDYYNQSFHSSVNNWQPFFWKGFKQTTRYTYIIEDISDPDRIYKNLFHSSKHKHIKKAQDLTFDLSMKCDEFYEYHKKCLTKKGLKISYSKDLFEHIHKNSSERNQGQIFCIKDNKDNIHAALFNLWDKDSAYNLITAIDPKYSSSGASTRIIWEIIKFLKDKTRNYDFEGSMIEGVAKTNQEYGASLKPYFKITKTNSKLLSIILRLKNKHADY